MSITNGGNVGVGNTNPQAKLDVNGNLNANNLPIAMTASGNDNGHCSGGGDLDQLTINAPGPGSIFVSAFLTFSGSDDTVDFSLNDVTAGTTITTTRGSVISPAPGTTLQRTSTMPLSWSIDIPAGQRTLKTSWQPVLNGGCISQHALTAVYLPKKQ